jgi:hypothetical protein
VRSNNRSITDRCVIANENLIGEDAVKHHFVTDVHTFSDIHSSPAVNHRSPAFHEAEESNFIQKETPDKLDGVSHLAEETFVSVKIHYLLRRHPS